ncbi:hypothetical protein ABBQ38_011563 [Trebouxia sp. C0009 RCD-2024]
MITDVWLTAAPGTYFVNVSLPDYPDVPQYRSQVIVRACVIGEVAATPATCTLCPAATFSLSPANSSCDTPCPNNAECLGGAILIPEQGYWHSAADSTYMASCPNPSACSGARHDLVACQNASYAASSTSGQTQGSPVNCSLITPMDSQDATSYMRKQCAEGHYGPLCSLCIRDGPEPYGRTGTWACQKCRSNSQILGAFAASNLLVLAFLYWSIYSTLMDNEEDVTNPEQRVKASELTRALTLWMQYISMVGSTNVSVPISFGWLFSFTHFAFSSVSSGILSTDCLIGAGGTIDPAIKRVILRLAMPWFTLVILILAQVLRWWYQSRNAAVTVVQSQRPPPRGVSAFAQPQPPTAASLAQLGGTHTPQSSKSEEIRRRLLVTLLVVGFYYYPSLVTDALSLFACYNVDRLSPDSLYPGNSRATWHRGYWLSDMSMECFTGQHMRWSGFLGVPLLVITTLSMPLISLGLLLYHRGSLDLTSVRLRYGFIYSPYRNGFWFWDNVVLLTTFALAVTLVFASTLNTYFQLSIMLMIMVVDLTVLAHASPHREALSQSVQVFSRFTVVASTLTCIYFVDETGVASKAGLRAAAILVLLLNALFLLVTVVLIVRAGMSDGLTMFHDALTTVKKLFGKLGDMFRGGRPSAERRHLEASPSVQLGHRGSSMELLRNTIFSKSGTIIEHGDSARGA